jgi:hypothetical protein
MSQQPAPHPVRSLSERGARAVARLAIVTMASLPLFGGAVGFAAPVDSTPPRLSYAGSGPASVIVQSSAPLEAGEWARLDAGFDETGSGLDQVTVVFRHEDGARITEHDRYPEADKAQVVWVVRDTAPLGRWTLDELYAEDAAGNWTRYWSDGTWDDSTRPCGAVRCTNHRQSKVGHTFTVEEETPEDPPEYGYWSEIAMCGSPGCATESWCDHDRFEDVCTSNQFRFDITEIALHGITKGCDPPDNARFCPTSSVTRGEMAAFLVRALHLPASADDRFTDDDGSVFESYIQSLAAAGITVGCNPPANDRFCPDASVTRAEMATFLSRALGLPAAASGGFVDVSGSNSHARNIDRLAAAGITRGCNPPANDRFCPSDPVTREQMAAFLVRSNLT